MEPSCFYAKNNVCIPCYKIRTISYWQKNKKKQEDKRLRRLYKISLQTLTELKMLQNGRCLICNNEAALMVDHCHNSGEFRGLICRHCNLILGHAKDNIVTLQNSINYLQRQAA
jgi:RNase P subunit RPR2